MNPRAIVASVAVPMNEPAVTEAAVMIPEVLIEPSPVNPKATVATSANPVTLPVTLPVRLPVKLVAVITPEVLIEPSPVNPKATVATSANPVTLPVKSPVKDAAVMIPEVFTLESDVNVVAVVDVPVL